MAVAKHHIPLNIIYQELILIEVYKYFCGFPAEEIYSSNNPWHITQLLHSVGVFCGDRLLVCNKNSSLPGVGLKDEALQVMLLPLHGS